MRNQGYFESWGLSSFLGTLLATAALPVCLYKLIKFLLHLQRSEKYLSGKVVVITGASSGLGEALAHEFYKRGCKVVLCARRQEELDRVRNDLLQMHSTAPITYPPIVTRMDLSNVDSLEGNVKDILRVTDRIDVLVNNGGVSNRGTVFRTDLDVFTKVMAVNFFGTVALTKVVLSDMLKRRSGHIVMVSSVQGMLALPHRSAYGASKHALQAFSDSLRAEVAQDNIKVTVVCPGYINTRLSMNALTECGKASGQMDKEIRAGYSSDHVAQETVLAVVEERSQVTVAPLVPKLGIVIRHNFPSLYFWIMARRATT